MRQGTQVACLIIEILCRPHLVQAWLSLFQTVFNDVFVLFVQMSQTILTHIIPRVIEVNYCFLFWVQLLFDILPDWLWLGGCDAFIE
jgi:hypothetical protein